jgi:hypothetical protein
LRRGDRDTITDRAFFRRLFFKVIVKGAAGRTEREFFSGGISSRVSSQLKNDPYKHAAQASVWNPCNSVDVIHSLARFEVALFMVPLPLRAGF